MRGFSCAINGPSIQDAHASMTFRWIGGSWCTMILHGGNPKSCRCVEFVLFLREAPLRKRHTRCGARIWREKQLLAGEATFGGRLVVTLSVMEDLGGCMHGD